MDNRKKEIKFRFHEPEKLWTLPTSVQWWSVIRFKDYWLKSVKLTLLNQWHNPLVFAVSNNLQFPNSHAFRASRQQEMLSPSVR